MNNELMSSLTKDIASQKDQLQRMFSIQEMANQFSSAKQINDTVNTFHRIQLAANEDKALRSKSRNAQVESVKILSQQHKELEIMKDAINALLDHNLEQALQQTAALQERDIIENKRFNENNRLSKIAAWAGVFSTILAAASIFIQIFN